MTELLRDIRLIAAKDLAVELRSKQMLTAAGVFGVLILVVFNLGFHPDERDPIAMTPGVLWAAFLFAGNLALERSLSMERNDGCILGLLVSPIDRGAIYLGKFAANLAVLLVVEAFLLTLHLLFFSMVLSPQQWLLLASLAFLGSAGYVAVGTLMTAVAGGTGHKELVLPLLLIPLAAPILIGAVRATTALLHGAGWGDLLFWFQLMLAYDGVFLTAGFLLFEFALEE
ncbi:MAG: heme ABC transporter permease [Gemmatimonadetes bacterium]|nr:heme ABC transporter permease [Gemmatimonadota bacterium]